MRTTIGWKLGAGFGTVILLLIISAVVTYFNMSRIQSVLSEVLDKAAPVARSCERISDSLNEASAALRGYLALSSDSNRAAAFAKENGAAWDDVERELTFLKAKSAGLTTASDQEQIELITRKAREQRGVHSQILELTSSEDNVPARFLFNTEFVPRAEEVIDALTEALNKNSNSETSVEQLGLLKAFADLRASVSLCTSGVRDYLTSGDDKAKRACETAWQACERAAQQARAFTEFFTATQRQDWSRAAPLLEELGALQSEVVRLRSNTDWNRAEHLWTTEAMPRGQEIWSALKVVSDAAGERELAAREQLRQARQSTVVALVAATLAAIGIGVVVAVTLSRSIAITVQALAERAQQISEGNLTGAMVACKGSDELSHLATGFNSMLANLRDLTGQILSVTENVNSATAQISSSTKQQAATTKEQAATVQEITSTMQELSQSGAQIVSKAKEVAAVSEQVSSSSKTGMEAVLNTNRTMEAIREQVEAVAENIVALSEKTQAVGEIITTVNEVAERSNLLALNASIEAAEAGEEGSRFSVVAGEMKNLADQAKECTVNVRKILGEIQKSINTSVMLTEEAVKRVESGKQQADVSEGVIRDISSVTEENIQAFQQIIGATNQQQVGFEQVAQGMRDIDLAAQQTATGTGQLEQAVVSLSALSKQLRTAVASYKI